MKMLFKFALMCGVGLAISITANAEDDVLSILGGGTSNEKPIAGAKSVKRSAHQLKKVFPRTTAEQNIFFELLRTGENEKALLQYFEAFGKTSIHKSANGQGLLSYLFLKNEMPVFAVENLFNNVNPGKLSPVLAKEIRSLLPDSHSVWKLARVEWSPKWTSFFSPSVEVQVKSRKVFTAKDTKELKDIIKVSAPGTKDRAAIQWQLVIALALSGESVTSAKLLHNLMKNKKSPVQMDLMNMTAARMLFENGYMDPAIKYYKKVPTRSDYWLEAQEEIGWSYIRKGEPQNTLAVTRGLVVSEFQNIVGPEAIFLRTLGQLKVCDYPGVVKTLAMFKQRFRPKTVAMLKLSENANNTTTKTFIEKMKKKRMKLRELGSLASKLPRLVTRDETLYQNVLVEDALEKEAAKAMGIYGRSLAHGTSKVGLQGDMEIFKKAIQRQVNGARNAALARLKVLAQEEVKDIHRLLQKLHIVEAEVLQQALAANKVISATKNSKRSVKKGTNITKKRDQITFPVGDGPVWFDEIANYKVDVVKGCQAVKR